MEEDKTKGVIPGAIKVATVSEEEEESEFGTGDLEEQVSNKMSQAQEGLPSFAVLPPGFVLPPGKQIGFMYFRGEWTDTPEDGDRWCMMWPLTEAEEKAAIKKGGGEQNAIISELAKSTIRVIDGLKVDKTGVTSPANLNMFWSKLGPRCRPLIKNYYYKTHTLSKEDQQDFFANCFVVMTAVAG